MRGEQTGVGVEPPGDDRATYSYVVVLASAYIALILVSVFVMDWFISGGYGYGLGRSSVDLWAASTCDPVVGCVSAPLEHRYAHFRPFAVVTLWTTATCAAFVLLRCGAYVLGLRCWRGVTACAYVMLAASATSVLVLIGAVPHSTHSMLATRMTPAPFVLLAAQVIGLLAVAAAVRQPGRVRPDRAPRIPRARIVNG